MTGFQDISNKISLPLYKQVVQLIKSDIKSGIYRKGERIPSINETSEELDISRDTVEKAYKLLRKERILESAPGKGYFVSNTDLSNVLRVCLLFNKLSNYKKGTYDSFIKELHSKANVDIHIYNYNVKLFDKIVSNNLDNYDYFVIVPHFHPGSTGVEEVIKKIPKQKVLIIDKKINQLFDDYPCVYQDFEADIIEALEKGIDLLRKYNRLNLLFPEMRFFSKEIRIGFERFCKAYDFKYKIIDKIEDEEIKYKEAYVVISDEDLVYFIKESNRLGYRIGSAVGVISYNENPVKEILENGITTISTNHEKIGEKAAQMLLSGSKEKIKIPFTFKERNSL